MKVAIFILFFSSLLTQKTLETKNTYCSSFIGTRYRKGHIQSQVTLTCKVMHRGHDIYFIFFEFLDPKNLRNKKKILIALALLGPEIGKIKSKVG